ncbi:hypothetical protein I316_06165 [Kwoniella heveanensis BCC8398]|uniref:Short-chain dehydrogenase/reductase SDR n=1 Tax=Kwoniella heveanensis BCC8398 TaxID=1296120 RepID=A0A1B9GME1_9TREE|nr:hypothetical protein I316_06165 [Kwoniella heveanensis BCC8398]
MPSFFANKNIVVIGSARGIGYALLKQLVLGGAKSILAIDRYESQDISALVAYSNEHTDTTHLSFVLADVTDRSALIAATEKVDSVDCLLCVAGVLGCPLPLLSREESDPDPSADILKVFTVNVLGTFNGIHAFQAKIQRGGRVMLMSSTMASMETATFSKNPAYSIAKAGVNMLGRKLAVELGQRDIGVVMMSPGVVRTEMNGGEGDISPEESAAGILRELSREGINGAFLRYDGNGWPW